ncbi:MAG: hypothetical protein V4726_12690 [Verrucomicrobiota bacterium]
MKIFLFSIWLILGFLTPALLAEKPDALILYRIGSVPVEMAAGDRYGVMLVNDGSETEPVPRYIVAFAGSRTVVDTRDPELFKAMLKRIPAGTVLTEYDSCSVPRAYGLSKGQISAWRSAISGQKLKIAENTRITCYCEKAAP